ncbi:glycosyltransferase family 4 protein [candidate division KSB1 bacterium]|nr:glycosyltransferase family 4 protein [candidate division KSB1 bacterium]
MRILYLTQYFPPEVGATQTRAIEMASNLVKRGHLVTVLTEFPNHPKGIIPPEYKNRFIEHELLKGIHVYRSWVYARPEKNFYTRMGFYLSYMLTCAATGSFLKGSYDVVYATSPPFFVGVSGLWLSRLKNTKFVFEVRDLWPESAVELGELSNRRFIKWAEKLENYYYRKADAIIAVTGGIRQKLEDRGYKHKVKVVLNGTNTDLFENKGQAIKTRLGLNEKFVVLYAGIIGIAQGMEQLCDVVNTMKSNKNVHFVFIGEGPVKSTVHKIKQEKSLNNLTLLDEVPREIIPDYISAADCCIVPLKKNRLFLGALPSKMFDVMACERPVILSVDGEARTVLEDAKAGIFVEPENSEQMMSAIQKLQNNPALRRQMGKAGRKYVEQNYSRRQKALELEQVLIDLTNK